MRDRTCAKTKRKESRFSRRRVLLHTVYVLLRTVNAAPMIFFGVLFLSVRNAYLSQALLHGRAVSYSCSSSKPWLSQRFVQKVKPKRVTVVTPNVARAGVLHASLTELFYSWQSIPPSPHPPPPSFRLHAPPSQSGSPSFPWKPTRLMGSPRGSP